MAYPITIETLKVSRKLADIEANAIAEIMNGTINTPLATKADIKEAKLEHVLVSGGLLSLAVSSIITVLPFLPKSYCF